MALYLLSQINDLGINIGLYRDDGLGVSNKTPRQNENLKKQLVRIFSRNGLDIKVDVNLKTVDFLDVTFDLTDKSFRPYVKNGNITNCNK